MRIILTQPKSTSSKTPVVPYAQLMLAANIEDAADVALTGTAIDGTLPTSDSIMESIKEFDPDVVGISMNYSVGYHASLELAKRIRADNPDRRIIGGGHHATFCAVDLVETGFFDAVFMGEGEESLRQFVTSGDFDGIPGVVYRKGETVVQPGRAPLVNVNDLKPPAYHLLPKGMKIVVGTETSRGCPYKCDFCETTQFFGKGRLRKKTPERFLSELGHIVDTTGGGNFFLMDDCFTADMKGHVKPICDALINSDLPASLCFQGRLDDLASNKDLIPKMVEAGFTSVVMGVETIYKDTLKLMNKRAKYEKEDIRDLIMLCRDSGMAVFAAMVFGYPGETPDRVEETIDFLVGMDVESASITIATPIPGSPLFERVRDAGELLATDYSLFDGTHRLTAAIPETTPDAVYKGIRDFYLRPDFIRKTLDNAIDPAKADVRTYFPAGVMSHNISTRQARPRNNDEWGRLVQGVSACLADHHDRFTSTWSGNVKFTFDEVEVYMTVKDGKAVSGGEEPVEPDLVVAAEGDDMLDLFVWCPLDLLSAAVLGRASVLDGTVANRVAFLHWFDEAQSIIRWAITIRWAVPVLRSTIDTWVGEDENRAKRWREELGEHGALFVGVPGGAGLTFMVENGDRTRDVSLDLERPEDVAREIAITEEQLGDILDGGVAKLLDVLEQPTAASAAKGAQVFTEASAFFETLPEKFRADRAANVDIMVQYNITTDAGDPELRWVKIKSGELTVGQGEAPDTPTATLTVPLDSFLALANGHASPMELFQQGAMSLRGFPQTMIQMGSCFDNLFGTRG